MHTADALLNETITYYAKRGYVVTAATADIVVMARPKSVNHAVHAVLSILTLGIWLWVWLVVAASAQNRSVVISTYDGSVLSKSRA